jgi:hypothetical protein
MGVAAFDVNSRWCHFAVFSPILTFVLLMFLSGIPMSEERYDKRYGRDPQYRAYKRSTAPLIPTPFYGQLPNTAKLVFCCEVCRSPSRLRPIFLLLVSLTPGVWLVGCAVFGSSRSIRRVSRRMRRPHRPPPPRLCWCRSAPTNRRTPTAKRRRRNPSLSVPR